ncbi:nuclear transport factor 2 family protein [Chondromyces crocatus]|uniref:Epoxide hydrolase n=1 Tax=Chondromyces crocatus TaxID=52 RepID=A0A0K1EN69_CHOCO|nr:nuclear transport factor 2 family protein [Chondromyces crocatus]AKT42375.1 epoxide hydrolase [Chondromyces crocatus]
MSVVFEFIEALEHVEETGDVEPMARLFTPEAELSNLTMPHVERGVDGVRRFWAAYRGTFKAIRSEFRCVVEGERASALEWTSRARASDGAEVMCKGVSMLEHAGGKIRRFQTYIEPQVTRAPSSAA